MRKFVTLTTAILIILSLSLVMGGAGADRVTNETQAPPFPETANGSMPISASTSVNTATQYYVVTATNTTAIDTEQLSQYGDLGVQTGIHIELRATRNNRTAVDAIDWVDNIRLAAAPHRSQVPGASDGQSLGVEKIHATGATGEDVTVGVIDFGFDATAPEIEDNVVKSESFTMSNHDRAHGTAVAEIVTRTAPSSDLHLVSAYTDIQYRQAIEYLTQQDVDIIVSSVSYSFFEDDGDHFFTTPINNAEESGILFVNSAGNHAKTHWEGPFQDGDDDGYHEWIINGAETNCIPDCTTTYDGQLDITLRWKETGEPSGYGIGVYNPARGEYIGTETTVRQTGSNKYVRIAGTVPQQPIDLVVTNTRGPADDEIEVIVDGPSGMQQTVAESSITAPADVPTTFSVAAYEVGERRIAPYSSRGPTDDGRRGIDVTGYTNIAVENGLYGETPFVFSGTSAAAPYVGGIAALATANLGGTPADEVAPLLRRSSDDILLPGDDTTSGTGVVNATAAININDNGGDTPPPSDEPDLPLLGGQFSDALYQGASGTAYQGQDVLVTGDDIVEHSTYELREISRFDNGTVDGSQQVKSLSAFVAGENDDKIPAYAEGELSDGQAFLVIETEDLDQNGYFIRGDDLPVNPEGGTGTFEIVIQDLSIAFNEDDIPVPNKSGYAIAELEIESNRVNYNANVSADGDLNEEKLVSIFINTDLNNVDDDTVMIGGNDYTETAIQNAILEAREDVTTDRDGNVVVTGEDTVDVEDVDGNTNSLTVYDLLETDANPFNVLVYSVNESRENKKIVLNDISNLSKDIDFTSVSTTEYTLEATIDDTTATADTIVPRPDEPNNGDGGTGLTQFDTDGSGQIDFQEVLAAISANNNGETINGEPVSFQDVLAVITASNERRAV